MFEILKEKDAIRELLAEYCHHIDAKRFGKVGDLFVEDGEWIWESYRTVGPTALTKLLGGMFNRSGTGRRRAHLVMNVIIKVDKSTAHSLSNILLVREGAREVLPCFVGIYDDDLIKIEDTWKFRRRKITTSFSSDLGLSLPSSG